MQELEFARKTEARIGGLEGRIERLVEENGRLKNEISGMERSVRVEREENAKDARVRLENLLASVSELLLSGWLG